MLSFQKILLPLIFLLAFPLPTLAQSFSDTEVELFVEAQAKIMEIRGEYAELLDQAADRDEAMTLEQEASKLMVNAIKETGMSVAEFSAIAEAAANDMELAERIRRRAFGVNSLE